MIESWERFSNVRFTGWGKCESGSLGIRIRVKDAGEKVQGIGTGIDGKVDGMILNFVFATANTACSPSKHDCIRVIAAHEFGHALGFAHEHNRPDTPVTHAGCTPCTEDADCGEGNRCANGICRQGNNGDVTVGAWDPNSIMNYCNDYYNNNINPILSLGDILGVQQTYGPRWTRPGGGDVSNAKGGVIIGNKMFLVSSQNLYSVDLTTGERYQIGTDNWTHTTALVEVGGFLFIQQGKRLWKVNLFTGTRTQIGIDNWRGVTAMTAINGKLYYVQEDVLWETTLNPISHRRVGNDTWIGVKNMTTMNGKLYIGDLTVWEVNLTSGVRSSVVSGPWKNTSVLSAHDGKLYAIRNGILYRIDLSTNTGYPETGVADWKDSHIIAGKGTDLFIQDGYYIWKYDLVTKSHQLLELSYDWSQATLMAAGASHTFVIEGSNLWKVDPSNGKRTPLGTPSMASSWGGSQQMVFHGNSLYIRQHGAIWRTNITNGSWERLGDNGSSGPNHIRDWSNVTAMAAGPSFLYAVEGDMLVRIAPQTGERIEIGGTWLGSDLMVHAQGMLYIRQGSVLYDCNTTNNAYSTLDSSNWQPATAMTTNGSALFVQRNGQIWRLDLGDQEIRKLGPASYFGPTHAMTWLDKKLFVLYGNSMVRARIR